MNKYFRVAKLAWDETVVYRLNFVMWRMRAVLQILTLYFLWASLIPSGTTLFGYNQSQMLTYIIGTSLVSSIVLSSRSSAVGDEINSGNLSNFFAGGLFPLDILPKFIFSAFQLLPFTYLLYFPIKVYLGQLTIMEIFNGIMISLVWTVVLYGFVQYVWKKGLLVYT